MEPVNAAAGFPAGERFDVRQRLGAGGMGVVYEAYDREFEQLVALKTLRHADGRWLARFKREFRSMHDIVHRNIVTLGEFFDRQSDPFFTMELVRGVNFLAYVRGRASGGGGDHDSAIAKTAATAQLVIPRAARGGPAPAAMLAPQPRSGSQPRVLVSGAEARLRLALRQLVEGLTVLHRAGKVHRDIKPSNILVTEEGRLVLLDFGLVAEADVASQSTDGRMLGTAAYMAPEQGLSREATLAADWYSLGVLLFEALTGVLPYSGRTPYEILLKKQQLAAPPAHEFAAEVPPDLAELCSRLLQSEPGARPSVHEICDRLGVAEHSPSVVAGSSRSAQPPASAPFVGRAAELETLRGGHEGSRTAPVIHVVEGVSGVGKTQLVEHFLEHLTRHEPDVVVLAGRCYEREMLAYKAFDGIADALARHLARLSPPQLAALMPLRPALLGRLFPVLNKLETVAAADEIPDVPEPHDQRQRMFAALRELFLRLAEHNSLVWFIDDLQWTDADSLVLLQDLLTHEERLPVFIVATVRPVDDPPRQALLARVAELAPTTRIHLDELGPAEARELAGLLLPGRAPATLDALASEAGGHPMLLQELARHADTRPGDLAGRASLDDMLGERIGQLGSEAQSLLQVVSLFGGPLSHEVAAVAAGLSSADEVKAANTLRAAHLMRTDGVRRTDRLVAYHDRVREHVSARLDATRRTHLHQRLAMALEQTGAAEHDPRALVRHARAAGRHALAATYAQAAARHAVTALAFDQAAELFATAIELGDHDEASLRHLRIDLATALMHAGRGPEAAATFMAAAEGAEPAVRLDCQRQAADQWIITGHIEQGLDALRASLADIGEPLAASPRRALASVLYNRVRLRLRGTSHEWRPEHQVPAETLRRLDVLKAVAHGLAMVDNIRGADFNGRYLLLALETGEPRRLLGAMATEVVFLASQGARAGRRARQLYGELVTLAEHCPDQAFARTWLLLADGAASFFEGRFTPAVQALQRAEEIFADGPTGLTYERNNTRVFRIHALRLLGALRRQGAQIAELVRTGRQRGDHYLATTLELLASMPLLAQGDLSGARTAIDGSAWSPPEQGFHLQHWYELRSRADLALYEGTAPLAVEALAPRFAELQRSMLLRVKIVRADAVSLRGRLFLAAAAAGQPAARARAEVVHIARQLERERVGYATVYALLLRAGLGVLEGGRAAEDTVGLLRRAIELAAQHDMALHLAAARHRLGVILGGDEGAALGAAAADYVAAEAIVDPARMFEVVAPGFTAARAGRWGGSRG